MGDRFSVIIPVYNHQGTIAAVATAALALGMPVIVIDDGSSDGSYEQVRAIAGLKVLRHPENRGKGAAILTGFEAARGLADWAITLDADGQHDPADAANLMSAIAPGTRPLVVGRREGMTAEAQVPWASRFGRRFSNFWVRACGGPSLTDSQSGFRLYPLPESLELGVRARRFQFEVEFLVRANWARWPVVEAPVSVRYPPGRKRISHYRPFVDFLRNGETFGRLLCARPFHRLGRGHGGRGGAS